MCIVVLLLMVAETDPEEKKLLNKVIIFACFVHKKYTVKMIMILKIKDCKNATVKNY